MGSFVQNPSIHNLIRDHLFCSCTQSHEEETAGGTHEAAGPKSWSKRLMRSFRFDHVLDDEAEGDAPAAPAPNMLTRLKRATSKMWISGGGATSSKHIMLNNDHGWFKDGSKVRIRTNSEA